MAAPATSVKGGSGPFSAFAGGRAGGRCRLSEHQAARRLRQDGAAGHGGCGGDVAQGAGLDWDKVGAALKAQGRLHLETY